ncbi:MAG: M55 family metallopeptidase [Thermanaeromonas sp.]|uniref:M55 family metallopeptidase n=1 Tax=Thermanaeromonas sp. TaxID=2003697 RepID=UPI002437E453|nr:M55 family metallopeptidase [Thermanaeromonas sp.]MCG0277860.1 M55 family metallopeptidase [Thermanaeromonas sp.]
MHVYISADMEGVAGVTTWEEVEPSGGNAYQRACRLLAGEVNAAVRGALAAGATRVVVNDAHNKMHNLQGEALSPKAHLIKGGPKPLGMMEGIDPRFNAVLFVGYHARAGSAGVLAHTYTAAILSCRVNGREVGEIGLNAWVAGLYGIPVVVVSGDNVACAEARELLGEVKTVVVKEARSYYSAYSLSPVAAREKIKLAVLEALGDIKSFAPLKPPAPVTLEVEFKEVSQAEAAALLPRSKRRGARTVVYETKSYMEAYRAFRAMAALAKS